ncbi:hypothetical protein [Chryseobacterium gambrini]|uniref:Uncharacterized protein n=1 Tax=Chryseobacterium gambrini TaxID=373672 RepID=A0A1N7PGT8_9FLAO|nr:hypothetical protein [Chryseobacterium gambrini]SIT09756.1 hypothetical protein SAMN05421785_106246 [Chryseobacterium gambrini]
MNNAKKKSSKRISIFIIITLIICIWAKLEFYSKDYYSANSFTGSKYELQAARFIESRHIKERFDNVYPWIIPFFSDDVEYFYGHSYPSKAYIKLYYMYQNCFYKPYINVNEWRLTHYFPEIDQVRYRLIGTQTINGIEYKFDEIVTFNHYGKIVHIDDLTNQD